MELSLPGTLVFDYPSISAISSYIAEQVAASSPAVLTGASTSVTATRGPEDTGTAINVAAVSLRTPDETFTELEGSLSPLARDAIRRIPLQRWDLECAAHP